MGQNTSKSTEKYNALRMSGRNSEEGGKPIIVRLNDGTKIDLQNVCGLYAERYLQEKDDATRLLNVIETNFDRLIRTKERRHTFLELPKAAFINILKSDDLYATNEYTILVLIGAWVDHQITKKMEKAKKSKKKKNSKKKKKKGSRKVSKKVEGEKKEAKEELIDPLVKLKQKQLDEDAILAVLLQDAGDDADGTKLAEGISLLEEPDVLDAETINNFLERIEEVHIPKEKSTTQYEEKLRAGIAQFAQYVRFPSMSDEHLQMVLEEGLVSEDYIFEAIRYRAMCDDEEDYYKKLKSNNPRFKPRGGQFFTVLWDPLKKDNRLAVNKENNVVTVVAGSGCAHKAIVGKYSISTGRAAFEVTLNQRAGCYDAIGMVDAKFKVQSDSIIGVYPNSYGLGLYSGTHVANSNRRVQLPQFGAMVGGTKVKLLVDMDQGSIEFFVNGTSQRKLKGLRGPLYPAMTMCEVTGSGYSVKNLS